MTEPDSGWRALLRGRNAASCAVVGGGMVLHALNTFITVTVMPSVIREIGGVAFFAWATTLYVLASLFGGAFCARLLHRVGARWTYRGALAVFAIGSLVCGLAPAMPVLLAGRFLQGLGAGTLSALSFTMVRVLFAQVFWSRAISIISAAWGVATLLGPAVGGVFAEYGAWRAGFWSMSLLAPVMLLLVELSLPRGLAKGAAPRTAMALLGLGVLAASVLCVSVASTLGAGGWDLIGLAAALAGLALFVHLEGSGGARLLPSGACRPTQPLGAAYLSMSLLLIGINVEIFVPYFLQTLHAMRPINAGYLSALMSGGWTTGSVLSSGSGKRAAERAMRLGPLAMAGSIAALLLLLPHRLESPAALAAIGAAMAGLGLGIGMAWPHVGARVFAFAPEGERELAASSITIVIMVTNAFASALAGLITNLAGIGTAGGAQNAALWLFGCFLLAPVSAAVMLRRLIRHKEESSFS